MLAVLLGSRYKMEIFNEPMSTEEEVKDMCIPLRVEANASFTMLEI